MLLNYFNIAIRNFAKYKVFSFINVFGMALSLASCLLILLFVSDELRYDTYHPDGDRTFRVYNIRSGDDGTTNYLPIVPFPFASAMKQDFPEVESTLRMIDTYREQLFEFNGDKILEPDGRYAEPSVFDMLTVAIISGDRDSALVRPNTMALSSSLAQKYFGTKDPVGESITIDRRPYEITAVYADVPQHSHLKMNYLISFSSTDWSANFQDNWQRQQIFTYLKLKKGADAQALEAKFKPFAERHAGELFKAKGFSYLPQLQNIADIHLHSSNFEWEMAQRGNAEMVYILAITAFMILVIAALNFINLSTARAVKRMKEVGIRKVVGASRRQLILQFIAESVVFTLAGLLVAVVMSELALPTLNIILDKQLHFGYTPVYVGGALGFCIALGILAGSYPAFQLSRFRPARVLAKMNTASRGTGFFRQSLVVLQFMFSFFLITGSWIILSQNDLLHHKDLGFDKEQVVVVPLTHSQLINQESTKQKYSDNPNIISATIGFGLPGDLFAGDDIIDPATGQTHPTSLFCVDYDYIKTMGMRISAGRDFSPDFGTDSSAAFIINETAVQVFGFGSPEEAVGKRLDWTRWDNQQLKKGRVVGVVEDFHFKSLRDKLSPVVLQIYPDAGWKLAVRVKPENMEATIDHLKKTYETLEQNWIFTYSFLDDNFDQMYKSEQRLSKLFTGFTYLAILVACLGLFGLVEYSVNQRTKEISIRKVFGASVGSLLMLLTKRYFILQLIACLLIVPLSYYMAEEWLSTFAYRIDLSVWLFVKAGLVILVITAVTVSFQSVKAALSNPANVLKND